ncbi:glycosylase [Marinithermofilum abyssi]|uniref:Glycosylase n=1 Tax=Marinithermofilum abyssi TaxID=1571185 RepID=A0A8J2VEB5_9BACL|nr:glycoside hydrolase family 130 protein [Marinithermofilum abyssi]GGE24383.1 glycosylase [Marinithermofilum abyssi]
MTATMLQSFPFGQFIKCEKNPILSPRGDGWESKDVFNPAAVVKDDKVYLLYRAEDHSGPGEWNGSSRIGLAVSEDGIHFERFPEPVLVPTEPYEQPGGCEDPRVTKIGDTYILTYTAFDGDCARMCLATSKDLVNWEKHGVVFPGWKGDQPKEWSKSGAILSEKINGKYVMYFGDSSIWIAWSEDGIHWEPEEEPVLQVRPGSFDSLLVEPGPQPLLTPEGILLIYNGARKLSETGKSGSGNIHPSPVRYEAGQVLFSRENPRQVLRRTDTPFFTPESRDEVEGQVDNVVFLEGLTEFRGAWYLYYGMADSKIGTAVYRP